MENNPGLRHTRPVGPRTDSFEYFSRLGRVRDFVTTHLDEDLSLDEVARVAQLSPKYFSAFFRRYIGTSYRDWVASVRVERAQALLAERNRSIARVAFMVGFRDVRTFQRAFKKVTGMTACAYKKSVAP